MNLRYKILSILLLILIIPSVAFAANDDDEVDLEELENEIENSISGLDTFGLEQYYDSDYLGGADLKTAIEAIAREGFSEATVEDVLNAIIGAGKDALFGGIGVVVGILTVLAIMGILNEMRNSFANDSVSKVAFWAGYILICAMSAGVLIGCVNSAREAIQTLSGMVETLTPIMITLLSALGGLTSESMLSPLMTAMSALMFGAVQNIVLPAILVAATLMIVSNISSTLKLSNTVSLILSAIKWMMAILFTVFIALCAIKGFSGATIDGISLKTAKMTIDRVVPMIGGAFSDTFETLMASGLIVKNAVGVVGLVIIACGMLGPLANLMINMFLFKLGSAGAQPFSDERCVKMLMGMADITGALFAALLTCSSMAFILISTFMGTSNMAAGLW